jgi:ribonuclease BN (tRNA processing enzyme)
VGKVAASAEVGQLILSHLSPRLNEPACLALIQQDYKGTVTFGHDLLTV